MGMYLDMYRNYNGCKALFTGEYGGEGASRLNPRGAALLADTVTYHTEPREAAELAQSAGVRMLVLSHLTQAGMPGFPETFTEGVEEGIEEGGKLDWHLAQDGMTLELPAGGTEINVAK